MEGQIDILFPEDQQEGTEAVVARWLVKVGDVVAAHDPVVEIETDKVVVEVAAPESGSIAEIRILQDGAVNPGDVLCTLTTSDQSETSSTTPANTTPDSNSDVTSKNSGTRRKQLSPAVKQRVMQFQLDISGIEGSGRNGRITVADVEALIGDLQTQQDQNREAVPATASGASEIIPHDNMRKRIAEHMVTSMMHTAPHVTAVFEADLTAVMQHRRANKEAFANQGTPLTLTAYFVAATTAAIHEVKQVNSRWHDDHLEIFQAMNIGIGTALGDKGLIVPVLHGAEKLDLHGIATGLADLTGRAREGKLAPADVRGGTFTISNHGVSGSLIATPIIINQPQSAILGVGKIEKRIKILEIDGEDVISIRPMCYISLTIDHRVLDGFQTNAFLTKLVGTLENWPA